ncbi:DMT family transporter [Paenibacillus sp. 481]|uniref:DMT family transporter n=1 Tax=Paenibacillus sp. 481 TaxID=2835869 RepID=UPI001E33A714|nr:SMR family transporter [Paenibacillus sp. 481]UHA75512.1 hypothetical protein KIK04_11255 [Paenibacillus sp. 481]
MDKSKRKMSPSTAWLLLVVAGLLEIVWASGFKYEQVPQIVVLIALIASFNLLISTAQVLPIGTVYAVFAGFGTIGTVVVDVAMGEQEISLLKIAIIVFLLVCIVGLKLTGTDSKTGNERKGSGV